MPRRFLASLLPVSWLWTEKPLVSRWAIQALQQPQVGLLKTRIVRESARESPGTAKQAAAAVHASDCNSRRRAGSKSVMNLFMRRIVHRPGPAAILTGWLIAAPAAAADDEPAYRRVAASVPVVETSDIDKGHPWRVMFGYPLADPGRLTLHQDWVVSYLDAAPREASPGGHGIAFGTDLSLQWQHAQRAALTPYYEVVGGIQYATGTAFPANGGRWMFTLGAGAGLLIPLERRELGVTLRWQHISNAGVFPKNAGYDAVHLVVGMRWTP